MLTIAHNRLRYANTYPLALGLARRPEYILLMSLCVEHSQLFDFEYIVFICWYATRESRAVGFIRVVHLPLQMCVQRMNFKGFNSFPHWFHISTGIVCMAFVCCRPQSSFPRFYLSNFVQRKQYSFYCICF